MPDKKPRSRKKPTESFQEAMQRLIAKQPGLAPAPEDDHTKQGVKTLFALGLLASERIDELERRVAALERRRGPA